MVRPSRRGRPRPLRDSEESDGVYTGDDIAWPSSPYEDSEALDSWKQPVRVATTGSITIATGLNAGDTIDGVTLVAGDRVLVKDQGTPSQNGIYTAAATPVRAADLDDDDEVLGAMVYVVAGTANAGTAWAVTNTAPTVVDTDAINWAEFGAGGGGTPATTVESETAYGLTPAVGTDTEYARQDHTHGSPSGTVAIVYVIDGGGSAITTGSKGFLEVPFGCTLTAWRVAADQSGNVVVDVKKATYSGLFTTSSIAASAKPTLSGVRKNEDTTLTGWTTAISAGDWLEFVVDSASTVTRVTVTLTATRS